MCRTLKTPLFPRKIPLKPNKYSHGMGGGWTCGSLLSVLHRKQIYHTRQSINNGFGERAKKKKSKRKDMPCHTRSGDGESSQYSTHYNLWQPSPHLDCGALQQFIRSFGCDNAFEWMSRRGLHFSNNIDKYCWETSDNM